MKLLSLFAVLVSLSPLLILLPALALSRKSDRSANLVLGGVIFVISYVVLAISAARLGFLYVFPAGFYFYCRKLLEPEWSLRNKKHLWHLVLPITCWVILMPWYRMPVIDRVRFYDEAIFSVRWFCSVAFFMSMVGYCWVTARTIRRFSQQTGGGASEWQRFNQARLKFFFRIFVTHCFLVFSTIVTLGRTPYMEIAISFAGVSTVVIGTYALKDSRLFQVATGDEDTSAGSSPDDPSPRYETSGLSADAIAPLSQQILRYLETSRCYTDSSLKLADLARGVRLSEYQTSQVINVGLKENFFTLINRFRIEEAKRRLSVGDGSSANILEVAYEVGFNSKSSFNSSFRKWAKMTPSQFRKLQTNGKSEAAGA